MIRILNYEFLIQFSNFFIYYSPYFEIAQDQNFNPYTLEEYLRRPETNSAQIKTEQINRIKKLIELTEQSIMQQSLLSGNTLLDDVYQTFRQNESPEKILLVNKVLENNRLFAYNFATYLLHKNLRVTSGQSQLINFKEIVDKINQDQTATKEQLDTLNKFMVENTPNGTFTFKFKEADKKLVISYTKENNTVEMAIPDSDIILENRMINSEAIQPLLRLRERLIEKLMDRIHGKQSGESAIGSVKNINIGDSQARLYKKQANGSKFNKAICLGGNMSQISEANVQVSRLQ